MRYNLLLFFVYSKELIIPALLFTHKNPVNLPLQIEGAELLAKLIAGLKTGNVSYVVVQRGATYQFSIFSHVSDGEFELVQFDDFVTLTVPNAYKTKLVRADRTFEGNKLLLSTNCYQLIILPGSRKVKAVLLEADNKFLSGLKRLYTPTKEIWA